MNFLLASEPDKNGHLHKTFQSILKMPISEQNDDDLFKTILHESQQNYPFLGSQLKPDFQTKNILTDPFNDFKVFQRQEMAKQMMAISSESSSQSSEGRTELEKQKRREEKQKRAQESLIEKQRRKEEKQKRERESKIEKQRRKIEKMKQKLQALQQGK